LILHALALTARDLGIGFLICTVASFALIGAVIVGRTLTRRADERYARQVQRELERQRLQLRAHEQRRSEMRSYNARPTAGERWGRAA
jgi:uncharacterized membrane-anchored protein YhcB (DUF1043 family)